MRMLCTAALLATLGAIPATAQAQLSACRVPDIAVEKVSRRVDGSVTHVSGVLVNKCPQAVGVHIRVALNDATDSALMVQDTWPASVKNIPAKGSFPFDSAFRNVPPGVAKVEVRVLEVKFWPVR
ncbi:MAG: hypothetical protein JSS40_18810 [Proteobacteria bacterium]|nr:hypothetical protein [Pseudomonadota bacterium]